MTFFGLMIAMGGSFLNIPLVICLYFLVVRPLYKKIKNVKTLSKTDRNIAFICSFGILIVTHLIVYEPGYTYFNKQCRLHSEPIVNYVDNVEYYYIDNVNPNGPFLELNRLKPLFKEGKIKFIEGPSHRSDRLPYIKYSLDSDDKFVQEEISIRQSIYGYKTVFDENIGVRRIATEVYKIDDNAIIFKYVKFNYWGGPLAWLTQPFGNKRCPNYGDKWFILKYKPLDMFAFKFEEL